MTAKTVSDRRVTADLHHVIEEVLDSTGFILPNSTRCTIVDHIVEVLKDATPETDVPKTVFEELVKAFEALHTESRQ